MTARSEWPRAGPASCPPICQPAEMGLDLVPRSNDRESRKRAEKQRRTVLNALVGELAVLLPLVKESPRKIDKTGVLRLAAHEIRKEHVFGDSACTHLDSAAEFGLEAAEALLDLVDAFLLTMTARGIVVVVSPNVLKHLGHAQIDLLGRCIFELTHPEDVRAMRQHLLPRHPECDAIEEDGSRHIERRDFFARLSRSSTRAEPPTWAVCRVRGAFRRSDRAGRTYGGAVVRRQRARRDRALEPQGNDTVFVALVHVLRRAEPTARLQEPNRDEYWTRHLVDGRIVHADQRISLVAGYMSEEVTGVSAFTFMHKEDVRWVVIALRQMYDQSKPYGESCYRLVSRTGNFMYLRTRGYLEVDPTTKAAQSFVCINSLLSDSDGAEMITEMKKRYSAIVDVDETDERLVDRGGAAPAAGLEDPRQLERVIMHLIADLPAGNSPRSSPAPIVEPLTIIPPKPSEVKSSIQKSLCVVSKSGAFKRAAQIPVPPPEPPKRAALADCG